MPNREQNIDCQTWRQDLPLGYIGVTGMQVLSLDDLCVTGMQVLYLAMLDRFARTQVHKFHQTM